VTKGDKIVKIHIILIIVYVIALPYIHILRTPNRECLYANLKFIEESSGLVDDSWVFTVTVKSSGTSDSYIKKIFVSYGNQTARIYNVTYVDQKGNIIVEDYLCDLPRDKATIQIPYGEYAVFRFSIPQNTIKGETVEAMFRDITALHWEKDIPLMESAPQELNQVVRTQVFRYRLGLIFDGNLMTFYPIFCIYLALFADSYLNTKNEKITA